MCIKAEDCTMECFLRFCFVVKTSADNVISQIFYIFTNELSLFFNSIEYLCLNKVNWVEKRLNSSVKMSKIYKITLSVDVFTMKQNLGKHSTVD